MVTAPCIRCGETWNGEHIHCAECGLAIPATGLDLCPYHTRALDDDWAAANRIWCDFFHRGVPLPRAEQGELV